MVQRLNVGGTAISSIEDTGLFRDWSQDSNSLMETSYVQPVTTTLRIKYTSIPSYTAPQKVYQTSWSMITDRQGNGTFNFTWKFPIDLGFRYLLRLHFCEFEYEREESDHTKFSIFVNEHVADAKADVIKWGGGNRVAVYRDYVVMMEGDRMEGKHNLLITYFPHNNEWIEHIDAVLRGLEVFKLSNLDRNLAGVNPMPLARASTSSNATPRKFDYASSGNTIATVLVILLSALNILVYKLHVWGEKLVGEESISPLPSEWLCYRFSLSEVLSMTNNFDAELVIGSGGFGNVYKKMEQLFFALKRLKSKSNQGVDEFRTEIEMLSNLRHTHLVSLIGYCDERQEMILVYEYMEHGTRRGIIHRNVKTTNILLDKDWVAKISDFGLCKVGTTSHSHTHVSTSVKGTFGYLDPKYFFTRRLTKKSDVYAFGVVLLEVLCGRPAVDLRLEEEQHSLTRWARQCIKEEKLDQLVDQYEGISARGDIDMSFLDERISTPNLRIFSFSELRNATKNFGVDALLGEGRFGAVYRGTLDKNVALNNGSGLNIVVKKLDNKRIHIFEDWQSEVRFLGSLSHSNPVKLLGYCWEDDELLVVYEFTPRGSLETHLFGCGYAVEPLPWDIRLKILIGAARGLAFLQTLKRLDICRGFKASNILLDGGVMKQSQNSPKLFLFR
ncbi:hypothetical protein RHSIM_Rhsim10G0052500 [Rhododendron simsii]|uniref:Protein kinase domain-containing protein n=1 Tax=Rhododendron simsii TaxID=118357 RepID=A0A834G9K9_RHOSS|nr:hypothetical protein RHSIM_Rhsim10G0052500 [Rhododendron simsii]